MTDDAAAERGGLTVEVKGTGQTASASAGTLRVINLETEATKIGGPDPIKEATANSMRADTTFRGWMVFAMCVLFLGLNAAVMWFLWQAFQQDVSLMTAKPPWVASDRLVTTNVLMSLIGATVVQTGVGFIAIVSYLFPKRTA